MNNEYRLLNIEGLALPLFLMFLFLLLSSFSLAAETTPVPPDGPGQKQQVTALYVPLADHYPGIVAYEKYGSTMQYADYQIRRMKSMELLRAAFLEGQADLAYIICPMAMDMFAKKPDFRWISLLHRDGNALAGNDLLVAQLNLAADRQLRKPDEGVAQALQEANSLGSLLPEIAVPSLLATHTVILHKYLNDYGLKLGLGQPGQADVVAVQVPPDQSPDFIKRKNSRRQLAAFEQSLPWADVVETGGYGKVLWYSKDVMAWPHGHVECIVIASDRAIHEKKAAIQEVVTAIHQSGLDIEAARTRGGSAMDELSAMIRKHIPEHNHEAISQSLRPDLMAINYRHLNIDKAGLALIMDYAVVAGILKQPINIDTFADEQFSTEITDSEE